MSYKVTRKKQFAVKVESTNGTKETISSSDYGLQLDQLTLGMGVEAFDNNLFKGSIDHSASRIGKATATCNIGGEFKNSGTLNTAPKLDPVLKSCRMVRTAVYGLAFSAASGTSTKGADFIVGGTSSARGRLVGLEGSKVYLCDITGTFTPGETLTDTLGSWTATAGATDVTATGFVYRAASTEDSEQCVTIFGNEDGIGKSMYGSAGNFSIDLTTDGFARFTASFMGVMDKSNWGTDTALIDESTVTWESVQPGVVVNASLTLGTFSPVGVSRVTADLGNSPMVVEDLNSDNWLRHAVVNQRGVSGTIEVLAIDPSDYNAYQAFIAGDLASMHFVIGSGAGKQIEVLMPYVQYTGLTDGDKDGFLLNSLTYKSVGDDMSFIIWFR